jgi:hypothetical protein
MNTKQLIERIKERQNVKSDYAVANLMDVMPPVVHMWTHGKRVMSDEHLPRAAELALIPLAQLACLIAAERSSKPAVKRAFKEAAAAVASFAIVAINLQLPMSEMPPLQSLGQCILCQIGRARRFLDANRLKFSSWLTLHPATTTRRWTWGGA